MNKNINKILFWRCKY